MWFQSFVYVSTAYSNAHENIIEEKIYPVSKPINEVKKIIDDGPNEKQIQELIGKSYLM